MLNSCHFLSSRCFDAHTNLYTIRLITPFETTLSFLCFQQNQNSTFHFVHKLEPTTSVPTLYIIEKRIMALSPGTNQL